MPAQAKGRIVGVAKCPYCYFDKLEVRVSEKNGFLYAYCPPEGDGGCKCQHFPRSVTSSRKLAKFIHTWRDAKDRAHWLGDKAPAKAAAPAKPPAKKETDAEPPADPPAATPGFFAKADKLLGLGDE